MAMSIVLEDERRQELERIEDTTNEIMRRVLSDDGRPFKVLRHVDPYGDTVFNRLQVPLLIADLEQLRKDTEASGGLDIRAIVAMAERCAAELHLYIRFIGD